MRKVGRKSPAGVGSDERDASFAAGGQQVGQARARLDRGARLVEQTEGFELLQVLVFRHRGWEQLRPGAELLPPHQFARDPLVVRGEIPVAEGALVVAMVGTDSAESGTYLEGEVDLLRGPTWGSSRPFDAVVLVL